jgi:hypothetical protein
MAKPKGDPIVHTLASLQSALGKATLDEAIAYVDGYDKNALVAEGRKVSTSRITTDGARLYGQAYDFLESATGELLDHVPAFSKDFLRIAVWAAGEGERRFEALGGTASDQAAKQAAGRAALDKLTTQAEVKRDQLHTALQSFAAGDGALVAAADAAYGTVAALGDAIRNQTALVRTWRTSGSNSVKTKVKGSRLTAAWLDAADAIAKEWDEASAAAGASRSRGTVTQADVDYLDGVNLTLLDTLVRWFDAGHSGDAGVPRLTYNALRSHAKKPVATPAPAPTSGASSPAS